MLYKLSIIASLLIIFQVGFAQEDIIPIPQKSPLEKLEAQIGIIDIAIEYSRPSARGRKIFDGLVPYDKLWRTGANINSRITFSGPVLIGSYELAEGSYSLFTIPGPNEWVVIFHKEYNNYGEPDSLQEENIIAEITVPSRNQDRMIETFSISYEDISNNGCNLVLAWEQVFVQIPLMVSTSSLMHASLEMNLQQTADAYAYAANNFLEIEGDATSALEAINFAISLREKDVTFNEWLTTLDPKNWSLPWYHLLKSEILADLGQKNEAIKAARLSLEICEKLEDAHYSIKKNNENIAKWSK